jgi:hypothetical protein
LTAVPPKPPIKSPEISRNLPNLALLPPPPPDLTKILFFLGAISEVNVAEIAPMRNAVWEVAAAGRGVGAGPLGAERVLKNAVKSSPPYFAVPGAPALTDT